MQCALPESEWPSSPANVCIERETGREEETARARDELDTNTHTHTHTQKEERDSLEEGEIQSETEN